MQVILMKDIPGLGRRLEVKVVADGFAKNFLIPKGFAKPATPPTLSQVLKEREIADKRREKEERELAQKRGKIANLVLSFRLKADSRGKLYGSLTPEMIHEALVKKGIFVPPEDIIVPDPIRGIGEWKGRVRLEKEEVEIFLKVDPEN